MISVEALRHLLVIIKDYEEKPGTRIHGMIVRIVQGEVEKELELAKKQKNSWRCKISDVSKEIEEIVTDDSFGLDPNERVVNLLKKINDNQEVLINLVARILDIQSRKEG